MSPQSEQDLAELAAALLDVIPRLGRRIKTAVFAPENEREGMPEELRESVELQTTPGQLTLLQILVEQEQCTMQDLASHLGVTPPTVTAMVKRLLAQGYVERIHGDTDWRTVWVKPTEKGRRVVQVYECIGRALLRRRLAHLDEEERAHLEAALPILRRLIELRD